MEIRVCFRILQIILGFQMANGSAKEQDDSPMVRKAKSEQERDLSRQCSTAGKLSMGRQHACLIRCYLAYVTSCRTSQNRIVLAAETSSGFLRVTHASL